jgi:hypothetical protein
MMPLKAIKVSDKIHAKLTPIVGELIAESCQMKTYGDAIEALIDRSVILPPGLLREVEEFVKSNIQLGYLTKEDFFRGAARWLMEEHNRKHKIHPKHKANQEKEDV